MMRTEDFAKQIRLETSKTLLDIGFGHLGGAFSIVETLAVLYHEKMRYDVKNPRWDERDWFVLSKGHAGPSYYATLALKGFFPLAELKTLNQNNTNLPSHPDRNKTVGVDITTGSLGQGISEAVGVAYGLKYQEKNAYVYCIVGDGECNEGQVWEAFQFAVNKNLDNLILFIDNNKEQVDGFTKDISFAFDFEKILSAFGFMVQTVDGQNCQAISSAVDKAKASGKVSAIVLDTVKGQGDAYFENLDSCHHINFDGENQKALENLIEKLETELEDTLCGN